MFLSFFNLSSSWIKILRFRTEDFIETFPVSLLFQEIVNTELLVSVHHSWRTSVNLEVFDVSQKEQPKKIYSFEEVCGSKYIVKIRLITL